jgi:predicted DNA binding CopG/RHH family protein
MGEGVDCLEAVCHAGRPRQWHRAERAHVPAGRRRPLTEPLRREPRTRALLRQLLDVVLRTANLDEPPTMAVPHKVNRDARLNVRLEPEDWRLLRERARARGIASATYLSYLARSHLRGAAPLP